MKIESKDNLIYIYLYRYKLDFSDMNNLNKEIKNVFIKLIKVYKLDFFGYSKVNIYENKKYGCILEIEKIYNNEFNDDLIDLKLIIHENTPFYLEFDDYLFDFFDKQVIRENNKYYLNLEDIDNLYKYIEFGKIVYEK